MSTRGGLLVGSLFVGAWLLLDCQPARADSIAFSDITASNLKIADRGSGVTAIDTTFTFALAHAQNSLGELDDEFDFNSIGAVVTWASGNAESSDTSWTVASSAHIPGALDGAANSSGQALWSGSFTVSCPTCTGSTTVDFSVDLISLLGLEVTTDMFGLLAQTETAFNLLVDGDSVLVRDDLLSIGPSDHQVASLGTTSLGTTLTGSMTLDYGTHDLTLRTDSESEVINSVPDDSATVTLFCLSLGALWVSRRRLSARDAS